MMMESRQCFIPLKNKDVVFKTAIIRLIGNSFNHTDITNHAGIFISPIGKMIEDGLDEYIQNHHMVIYVYNISIDELENFGGIDWSKYLGSNIIMARTPDYFGEGDIVIGKSGKYGLVVSSKSRICEAVVNSGYMDEAPRVFVYGHLPDQRPQLIYHKLGKITEEMDLRYLLAPNPVVMLMDYEVPSWVKELDIDYRRVPSSKFNSSPIEKDVFVVDNCVYVVRNRKPKTLEHILSL